MKKTSFLLLLAMVLLLSSLLLCSCKKDAYTPPDAPPATDDDGGSSMPQEPDNDGATEAEQHLDYYGYPLGFTLRFTKGDSGFDTGTGQIFQGSRSEAYDFSSKLRQLYIDMTEHNIYNLSADLTYATLSGGETPPADNVLYTLTFTEDGKTYSFSIDSAAMDTYNTSDVSNLRGLVLSLAHLADDHFAAQS